MDTTVRDPLVGQLLDGRYQVQARLARGGMATVYEALDTRLDRTVAVKVMHAGLAADDEFVARFIREAKAAARLSHPNVVAVYDQGTDHGHVFLAMEYVAGRTLRDLLRERGRLGPEDALLLLDPVLAALGAAHRAGLVHRDVKPENVLISSDGQVKVADFGLARAVSTASSSTVTQGVLIGTVSYLAPEQVLRGIADPRSDVYAAGVLLYEMVTGVKPFNGESPIQIAYQHVHDVVPPPSARVPGLPAAVDQLVTHAANRDPDARPRDAEEFRRQVAGARARLAGPSRSLDGRTTTDPTLVVPLPATPAPVTVTRHARGRGAKGLVIGLALVLLLVAGGLAWWLLAGPGRYTAAPSLLGLSRSEAQSKAAQLGFAVSFADPVFSETVERDHVLRTDPRPNGRIAKDGTIELTMSQGKERYAVPRLAGMTQDDAQDALGSHHLSVGQLRQEYSDTVASGKVISVSPAVGTLLRRDEAVNLVVSRGLPPVTVPDVAGKDADDARKALTKAGLRVKITERYDEQVDKGKVISQAPTGSVLKGATVSLVVSMGPPLVAVPGVVGSRLSDAVETLRAAGFTTRVFNLPAGPNRVLDQSPNGGTTRPKGSTITLSVF